MTHQNLLDRITARPDVFGGKPIIRDMRISVETILSLLSQGVSWQELLDDCPDLETGDIRACLAYARAIIANDSIDAVRVAGRSTAMRFLVDRCGHHPPAGSPAKTRTWK